MSIYQIILSSCPHKLQEQVNKQLAKGWEPAGGIAISNSGGKDTFYQALVKNEKISPGGEIG